MSSFLSQLVNFFSQLTVGKRLALVGVTAGALIGLISLAYWVQSPNYTLLFGEVEPSNANTVVETLRSENIPYELRHNGTAIFVPQERVHDLRLRFAAKGLVSSGQTGYELFDENTLGMTSFMQKINKKRALEGELARTINNLEQVQNSRVHLVLPERSPFRESQTEATASVVLKLQGGATVGETQMRGIVSFVAGAVEGLEAQNVTILDTNGDMLSNPHASNDDIRLTNARLRHKQSLEDHLRQKGQTMLNQALGEGNAILRVSTELDFTESVSEEETIDPESATVISEERLQESAEGANANSRVRNYEVSRSTERTQRSAGRLSYMTVSVIVNHKPNPDAAEGGPATDPRTPEELQEIESLIKNAVGFKPDRGDQFAIQQMRFDAQQDNALPDAIREQQRQQQIRMYLRYGLVILAILGALWLIWSTSRRVSESELTLKELERPSRRELPEGPSRESSALSGSSEDDEPEELILVDDIYTSKLSEEAKARLKAKHQMFEDIRDDIEDSPEEAANLIHTWLVEDQAQDTDVQTGAFM